MNLNTVTEVKRPLRPTRFPMARGLCLARRRHLAVLEPQLATHTLIDLEIAALARAQASADGLDIAATCTHRRARPLPGAGRTGPAAPLLQLCCQCASGVVQDLERGDRRRQHLHVAAGRPDDLADACARRHLHAVAARRGSRARSPLVDFVTGNHENVLGRANCLRSIHLPASGADQALRLPPRFPHPSRAVGGARRSARRARPATTSC